MVLNQMTHIKEIHDHENVNLDLEKIAKNPGRRAWAKLMANSQWGYLAMRSNKTSVKFINDSAEFFKFISDPMYEIKGIDYYYIENTKNYTLQVYYKIKDDFYEGNEKTNVVLAAFVTSQARLKLYSELEKLGERVLYFDTDSIFYASRPNEYEPKTGDQLGDLTNEIDSSI